MAAREKQLSCPSAPENLPDSKVFGLVVDSTGPVRVGYLDKQAIAHLSAGLEPTPARLDRTSARFSAACQESKCGHFVNERCSLSKKIVTFMPVVLDALPRCAIRSTCRWFSEEREQACLRCPQVVTVSSLNEPKVGVPFVAHSA